MQAKMYKGDKFFREIEENCYRASARLRDCDRDEVDVQVQLISRGHALQSVCTQ